MPVTAVSGRAIHVTAIASLALIVWGGPAYAQVTAQQGPTDPTEFTSPMILSTIFIMADPHLWTNDWFSSRYYVDLRKFHCDNVSISMLRLRGKRLKEGKVSVTMEVSLSNRVGHDKQVTVGFDILNGDDEVTHATLGPLQVDETDTKTRSVKIIVPESGMRMFPQTGLRITVTAKNV